MVLILIRSYFIILTGYRKSLSPITGFTVDIEPCLFKISKYLQ
jgi:hypothetical protein